MNPVETLNLSFRAITANRLRSFLTVLGIVIGVMSVILLIAVVSGLKTYITGEISGLGSNLIFVIPGSAGASGRGPGGATVNRLTAQDATDIQHAVTGQASVSPAIIKSATLKFGSKQSKNANITGVNADYPKIVAAIALTDGRFFTKSEADAGRRVAVIGPTVKTNLFDGGNPINKEIMIGNLRYKVIGVTKARGSTFGVDQDNIAVVPFQTMQTQFGITNVNAIYIGANSPDVIDQVQSKAKKTLEKRLSDDDFTIETQEQTLSTISQITGVLTLALGGIAAISLFVGGIGVMNIMLVSVTERTREIGLRKALGAQPKDIRNQFLIEAITLSSVGGIIGILLGIFFALIINHFFTTTVTWWSIVLSFGFSMIVGVIFGVAPAIRAAKLNPIQALRYE